MRIVSFTEARKDLESVLDGVVNDADCTVITCRDETDAVVMSRNYYDSLMETLHLLGSAENVTHLSKSIAQYKKGQTL